MTETLITDDPRFPRNAIVSEAGDTGYLLRDPDTDTTVYGDTFEEAVRNLIAAVAPAPEAQDGTASATVNVDLDPLIQPDEAPASGFAVCEAVVEGGPFSITHSREVLVEEGLLQQDYNYLTYHFGNPATPTVARHYLGDREVSVIPASGAAATLDQARDLLPREVVVWLRQRFAIGRVLTHEGYEKLWQARP